KERKVAAGVPAQEHSPKSDTRKKDIRLLGFMVFSSDFGKGSVGQAVQFRLQSFELQLEQGCGHFGRQMVPHEKKAPTLEIGLVQLLQGLGANDGAVAIF